MNKRIITGLVILMGFSLLGIIAVQVYWFSNSVDVRNELFDRSVNEAMNKAVRRLETDRDIQIIRNFSGRDSLRWTQGMPVPPPPPIPDMDNIDVTINRDSTHQVIRIMTIKSPKVVQGKQIFQVDSLKGKHSITTKVYAGTSYNVTCDPVLAVGIQRSDSTINRKMLRLKSLTNQIQVEYKDWESGRHIDENQLRKLLKEELMDRAIPIEFKISIFNGKSLVDKEYKKNEQERWYKVNLFPDDIFRKNLELAVYFPERNLFIGQTTSYLLGLSVVFTLVILLTFSLSIFLILRQKKISEMKSDFINNMTHEFKTPIATISIAADSISNEKVIHEQEKVRFFAGMIKKENTRMNEQVERILQIARLEKKEFEFNFQAVDVHELIEEAVKGIILQVEKRGGTIETRFEAGNSVVTTDPVHFTNLVFNLLDNANKYSPDAPEILVKTSNSPDGLFLSVEDHGMGMTRAVQSRIFDKFYRLPSGNVHTIKGFGLGLSYIKAILEANNGTIRVESEPGRGSKFVVFIPFINSRR